MGGGPERDLFADHAESVDAVMLWLAAPDWRIVAGNRVARAALLASDGSWPTPAELAAEREVAASADLPITRANVAWAIGRIRTSGGHLGSQLRAAIAPHFGVREFDVNGVQGIELFGRPESVRAHGYVAKYPTELEFRLAFEHAGEGIATVTLDGTFLRVNPRLAEMLGRPVDDIVGRRVTDFHHPTNSGDFEDTVTEALANGLARFERVYSRPDGEPVHAVVSSVLLRSEAGLPLHFIAHYNDVSAFRAVEAQTRQSQQLAVIGRLASGIAHDINNLLAGILGYAELLQSTVVDPALREHCERLIATTQRAGDFASGLLSFARVGESRHEYFDAAAVMGEVARFLDHVSPPGVTVRVELLATRSRLLGDPSQIHAALMNLGLNAAEAIEGDGTVTFRATNSDDGEHLVLAVVDTGVGLPAEQIERVFEPFFTTKRATNGTGLGLVSVRTAAERFGGRTGVVSEPGVGSTFTLELPLPVQDADPAAAADAPAMAPAVSVLVADDEEVVRYVVVEALRREGCDVVEAADGVTALAAIEAAVEPPDVLVFDLRMPAMGGTELFRSAHLRWPSMGTVLMSGFSVGDEADGLFAAGVDAVLQKPFTAKELTTTVASVAARRGR